MDGSFNDPVGGEPLRDLLGLMQQQRNKEELAKIASLLQDQERLRLDEQKRLNSQPQCPWCGGRLEGQFPLCVHCHHQVMWIEGMPCLPGQEGELLQKVQERREQEAERRLLEAAHEYERKRQRQAQILEQKRAARLQQEEWNQWKSEGSGAWLLPILWGLAIALPLVFLLFYIFGGERGR